MVTFTEDGQVVAEKITQVFRSKEPKIGVVLLKEQEKHVFSKDVEFVDDCFKQVWKFVIFSFNCSYSVFEIYLIFVGELYCTDFNKRVHKQNKWYF